MGLKSEHLGCLAPIGNVARITGTAVVLAAASVASAQTYGDWREPVDGLWHDPANWSPAGVPGVDGFTDLVRVVGPLGSPFFATIDSGSGPTLDVGLLLVRAEGGVRLRSGSLQAGSIRVDRGRFEFEGGTLVNSHLAASMGEFVVTGDTSFHDVTLGGILRGQADTLNHGPSATFRQLMFDGGSMELGEMNAVVNAGAAGLTGTGEIFFTQDPGYANNILDFSAATGTYQYPTIGENITIRTAGDGGSIGRSFDIGTGIVRLTNYGTIAADDPVRLYVSSGTKFDNQGTLRATNGGTIRAAIGLGNSAGSLQFATDGRIELDGPRYYLERPVTVPTGSTLQLKGGWGNPGGITVDGGQLLLISEPHTSSSVGTVAFIRGSGASVRLSSGFPLSRLAELDTAPDTVLGTNDYHTADLAGATFDLDDYVGTWDLDGFNFKNGTLTDSDPQAGYLPGTGRFMSTRDLRMQVPMLLQGDRWSAYSGTTIEAPVSIAEGGWLRIERGARITSGGHVTVTPAGMLVLEHLEAAGNERVTMNGGILGIGGPATPQRVVTLPLSGTPDEYHVVTGGVLDLEGGHLSATGGPVPWVLGGGRISNGSIDARDENGPLRSYGHSELGDVTVSGRLLIDATADLYSFVRLRDGAVLRGVTIDSVESTLDYPWGRPRLDVFYGENVTMDAVTVNTRASFRSGGAGRTTIVNGLTVNGEVTVAAESGVGVVFQGDQSVGGTGLEAVMHFGSPA